jgi:hypothetical protein
MTRAKFIVWYRQKRISARLHEIDLELFLAFDLIYATESMDDENARWFRAAILELLDALES